MKKIILKSLTLTNFRGEHSRTTEFDEKETLICGANGLGKSRHFDAFMWLLFGKDANGRKDYEIRTRVNSVPLHRANCEVAATLLVDGEEINLRRAFNEDWVKPCGQAEQVFKGHHTETSVNGVPLSVTEYKKRVDAIVDDSLFKMITNPMFFAGMDWKKQREQLFAIAGTISDSEIAQGKADYAALLAKLNGKDMEDYRKEVAVAKRKAKAELEQIQPRIDQTQRLMPATRDWAGLEKEIAELEGKIAAIDAQLQDKSEAIRVAYQDEQDKRAKCAAIAAKQNVLFLSARQEAQEAAFKANAARREAVLRADEANDAVVSAQRRVAMLESELRAYQAKRQDYADKMEYLRNEWHRQNERKYNGETTCPHCGQQLPDSMIAEAEDKFNDAVKAEKDHINAEGRKCKSLADKLEESIADTEKALQGAEESLVAAKTVADSHTAALKGMGVEVKAKEVDPESIPAWVELQKEHEAISATISAKATPLADCSALNEQKRAMTAERDDRKRKLSDRDTIAKHTEEIAALEQQGKRLAQKIASYEKEEFVMDGFTKAKINECEKRINGMFGSVKFQLYAYSVDGNPVETCIPLVDGVPFAVANTAGRVNAGLDIINTLCRFYNICAPIFIDNAESVNSFIKTDSQLIKLMVSTDKELTIKYNN